MKVRNLILAGVGAVVLIVGISVALPPQTRTQPASAAFDHSNCQYPDRWTNPVDGCDNSDPAVPECIKASYSQESEKACIDAFVLKNAQPAQTEPASTTPPSETVNQCGAK